MPEEIVEQAVQRSLHGPDSQIARAVLEDLVANGWVLLKPDDCCRDKIQDLDAEVWTP